MLLVSAAIRPVVRKLIEHVAPQVAVLSVAEVTSQVSPDVVGVVGDERDLNDRGTGDLTVGDLTVEDGYESANV